MGKVSSFLFWYLVTKNHGRWRLKRYSILAWIYGNHGGHIREPSSFVAYIRKYWIRNKILVRLSKRPALLRRLLAPIKVQLGRGRILLRLRRLQTRHMLCMCFNSPETSRHEEPFRVKKHYFGALTKAVRTFGKRPWQPNFCSERLDPGTKSVKVLCVRRQPSGDGRDRTDHHPNSNTFG